MNSDSLVENQPPSTCSVFPPGAADYWKSWFKRFLACNPFYLASAALLLYSIYRMSVDADFMKNHVVQLSANFGSLHLYEILLVVTSIFLARRRIWYDSTLLFGLENMFVLAPFILISQAVFLGKEVAWFICMAGGLLALAKFWGLKRFFPSLNLPARLLGIGAVMLLANILLPLVFKHLHGTNLKVLERYSLYCWFAGLPILLGSANFLQRPKRWNHLIPAQSWVPLGLLTLWVAVSGVHLGCIGYVYDLPWNLQLVAPAVWMLAWTVYRRRTDFLPAPNESLTQALFILPCWTPLLAIFGENNELFFILAILNAVAYTIAFLRDRSNSCALHLTLISLAGAFAGMPEIMGQTIWMPFHRETCVWMTGAFYCAVLALFSRTPVAGLGGAIATVIAMRIGLNDPDFARPCVLQGAMVFLLLHSLGWKEEPRSPAPLLRFAAAMVWVIHSFAWIHSDQTIAMQTTAAYATGVLAVYGAVRWITGQWGPKVVPLSALTILLLLPLHRMAMKMKRPPLALATMIGSYLLFAVGTWFALIQGGRNRNSRENDATP